MHSGYDIYEREKRISENEFNKYTQKHYHVNDRNELVIKGITSRLILDETEQKELLQNIQHVITRKVMGDEISLLERLALRLILDGTY